MIKQIIDVLRFNSLDDLNDFIHSDKVSNNSRVNGRPDSIISIEIRPNDVYILFFWRDE
jgi:hypothetical protein